MLFHDLSKYLHRLTLHSGFTCCIIKIFVLSVYYSFAPNRFTDYLKEKKKNEIIVSEVNKKNKKKTLRKEYKSHGRGYKRGLLGVQ